jgi:hypothetical protein
MTDPRCALMQPNRATRLEQLAQICRSGRDGLPPPHIEPTGLPDLDAALPGGGWQSGTIVELMPTHTGIGELRVLMPALASVTSAERHIALIAPPYVPYAPAFLQQGVRLERTWIVHAQRAEDVLWTFEQTLRCRSFGAVLAWPATVRDRDIRKVQLAAEAGRSIGFLYRPPSAARESSPAALRLRLQADGEGQLAIDIIKCRGGRPASLRRTGRNS